MNWNDSRNSSTKCMHNLDAVTPHKAIASQGVGARQGDPARWSEGGGYLSSGENFELLASNAMAELRAAGLPQRWLAIAERIGPATFEQVWKEIDDIAPEATRVVRVPSYVKLLRVRRNRLIKSLASEKTPYATIITRCHTELSLRVSRRTVSRVVNAKS